ncbi:MAG TPA: hypothetical protein VKX39_18660 [Bryobacteraceae bacterium]|jgi:hypothetical protein|nr:hypothetical protein [Bryobacteraceae bacterium]
MQLKWPACAALFAACGWAAAHDDAFDFPYLPFDHPAIQYEKRAPNDAITRLQAEIDQGKTKLDYDPRFGYLPSLLKHLGIHSDSQMLVFSKTSFQGPKISPKSPRALYFSDDAAVGYVPEGDVMEVIVTDAKQGLEFYTLEREKTAKPQFLRRTMECMQCHMIPGTLNVPGLEITSVIPGPDGAPRFAAQAKMVDHRTPFDDRWGGWYVTGTAGEMQSRANAVAPRADQPSVLEYRDTQNLTSLRGRFDLSQYPEPTSDIVALMTIEHQTRVNNLLTRLQWETRIAEQDGKIEEFKQNRLKMITDELVSYMLFENEAKMYDPVAGVSMFTKTFPQRGPRDKQGRSLRDFDLRTRMFRYPLSYMIYSELFDALPAVAKESVYQGLYGALAGKTPSRISAEDRRAIMEIVRDTKHDLPDYWK